MGCGESQAYREGLYRTADGYSFYGPDDEEENDMAVEEEQCSNTQSGR